MPNLSSSCRGMKMANRSGESFASTRSNQNRKLNYIHSGGKNEIFRTLSPKLEPADIWEKRKRCESTECFDSCPALYCWCLFYVWALTEVCRAMENGNEHELAQRLRSFHNVNEKMRILPLVKSSKFWVSLLLIALHPSSSRRRRTKISKQPTQNS